MTKDVSQNLQKKEVDEMPENEGRTAPEEGKDRVKGFNLLMEAEWKIYFLRDVANSRAVTAEQGDLDISYKGELGLALILEEIGKSLNQAVEML